MKLINEDKKVKTIDKLTTEMNKQDKYFMKIGPLEFEVPKEILHNIIERYSLWEADSVQDIKDNYSQITNLNTMMSDRDKELMKRSMVKSFRLMSYSKFKEIKQASKDLEAGVKEAQKFMHTPKGSKSNSNLVVLDNVYIGDYQFGETKWFDYFNMTLKDKFQNPIPAITIHRQRFIKEESTLEEELSMAMSHKDYSTAFDVMFVALPTAQKVPVFGGLFSKTIYHEPKLHIHSITKTGGDKEDWFPVDIKTFMPNYS